MPYRKQTLANNEIYHIYSKSIAGFKIFNSSTDYERMIKTLSFYMYKNPPCSFSIFQKINKYDSSRIHSNKGKLVNIIAFCIMPTHIHLLLKQYNENGISKFINLALSSYSRYFNMKHKRKGPLWEGRFKNVLVKNDDQFIHLTRYIHLNPATNHLVDNPIDWKYSSYREYIGLTKNNKRLCNFHEYFDINVVEYEKSIIERINYQRELAQIKNSILE